MMMMMPVGSSPSSSLGRIGLLLSFLFIANVQMRDAGLYDSCVTNCDCRTKYSICRASPQGCATQKMRFCQCADGYRANTALECKQEARLGQKCGDEFVCIDDLTMCNATTNRCECFLGFKRSSFSQRCVSDLVSANYGETCAESQDCDIYQDCISGRCQCMAGYKYDAPSKSCLESQLNDPCQVDVDCAAVDFAICSSGRCACQSGFTSTVVSLRGQNVRVCRQPNPRALSTAGARCFESLDTNSDLANIFCQPNLTCTMCPRTPPFRFPTESVCAAPTTTPACTVPRVGNGRVVVSLKTRTDVFPVRQSIFAQLQCDGGFRVASGADSSYCDEVSDWSSQLGQCQPQ